MRLIVRAISSAFVSGYLFGHRADTTFRADRPFDAGDYCPLSVSHVREQHSRCRPADNVLEYFTRGKFSSSSGSPRRNPQFAPHSTTRKLTQEEVVECPTPTRY